MNNQTIDETSLDGFPAMNEELMLDARNIRKYFPVNSGRLGFQTDYVRAVDGVDLQIPEGATFGLVGESGSGKTTLGRTLLRLIEPTDGKIEIANQDVRALSGGTLREFRKNMQIVFQDPTSTLNPKKRVEQIITKPMRVHDVGDADFRHERVSELMEIIGLPREYLYEYPTALSGGQKQRVGIARAVALNPEFVVLDEPTSALDVSVQARIVELFKNLQSEFGLTYLFISHDLSLIRNVADWVGVMYLGELVEVGRAEDVFRSPQHPYTRALISAIHTTTREEEKLKPDDIELQGEIPDPTDKPDGCAFRTRCPLEFGPCDGSEPGMYEIKDEQAVRCYLHDEGHSPDGPDWR